MEPCSGENGNFRGVHDDPAANASKKIQLIVKRNICQCQHFIKSLLR
jgi:hypothetical protein